MRIDVEKFLFIGLEEERLRFFQHAQELGIIHFIENTQRSKEVSADIGNTSAAIKVLRGLPLMQQEFPDFRQTDQIVTKILSLKHQVEKLAEEERTTRLEIERVAIFGDFSKEDIAYIEREGNRKVQFFFGKHGTAELSWPEELIYVGTAHELDYFVAINPQPTQYDKLIEMHIPYPEGELKSNYQRIIADLDQQEHELKTYQKYNRFLHQALVHKLNGYHLRVAQQDVEYGFDKNLFITAAWIPKNKVDAVQNYVDDVGVHMEEIAIESTDAVPTYLENKGPARIGQDVISIYDTPSTTDKDPSLWVLLSFAFFFAVIVGDAGYGMIFLAIALYLRMKHKGLHGLKRRILNLFTLLCFTTIAWGFLTNSFFGISFEPHNPIRKASLVQWLIDKKAEYHMQQKDDVYEYWLKKYPELTNAVSPSDFVSQASEVKNGSRSYDLMGKFSDNIMIELALLIGCIHIILSFLRYIGRNWIGIGWILFIVGAYLYLPHYLNATSMIHFVLGLDKAKAAESGIYLMIGGFTFACLGSLFKNRWLGLLEPMNVIQIFSDVLSYLRLYALGLAGSIVMVTVNESAGAVNFVLGAVLALVGHGINMALAIMGGVIHGLRLNFLEWYHYSFEGGGKKFKPLEKLPIE